MNITSKNTLPAGGWSYVQPETKFKFDGMVGFNEQVGIIAKHRKANSLARATPAEASEDLEAYTCNRLPSCCSPDYLDPEVKKNFRNNPWADAPHAANTLEKAESAITILRSWLGSGAEPVSSNLSTSRATICSACPYNKPASMFDLSKPAAAAIGLLMKLKGQKLIATPLDDSLGVCEICGCDLKTKVHTPIDHIKAGTDPDLMSLFPEGICWIRSESQP